MKTDLTKFTEVYKECINFKPSKNVISEAAKRLEKTDNLLLESHGFAITTIDKELIARESWVLFELLYEYIGGYKSYKSVEDLAENCAFIKFIYKGPLDDIKNFDINNCLAIGTYNRKAGIKMTSIAVNIICFSKQYTRAAARKLQRESLKFSWCEVSGKAEDFLINQCGALQYVINPEIIKQIYPDIYIDPDDPLHYSRVLTDAKITVRKIAFGTINV